MAREQGLLPNERESAVAREKAARETARAAMRESIDRAERREREVQQAAARFGSSLPGPSPFQKARQYLRNVSRRKG